MSEQQNGNGGAPKASGTEAAGAKTRRPAYRHRPRPQKKEGTAPANSGNTNQKPALQKQANSVAKQNTGKQNTNKQNAGKQNANRQPNAAGAQQPRAKQRSKHNNVAENKIPVRIMPLGGLGEVGKNMTLYECQGEMILVDCGIVFPDSDMFGIDLVIPDMAYVKENASKIKGVIITHGHEDHIGALPYLLREVNLPIYATRLTIGLIKNRLEEHALVNTAILVEINAGKKFKLGCFEIDPFHVNHSIPDAVGFAISCPAGVILHTGDFKIDYTPLSGEPTDLATIAAYGSRGVLAVLSDSTNAERPGFTTTEHKVSETFRGLFMRAGRQRIIIATFASNLYRIQQIIDIAVETGRKVAVSGRSMVNNTAMAIELGYLTVPAGVLVDIETINKIPPEQLVIITTGSQGEPLSALSRMSAASHRSVHVGVGDFIIISARPIPGNEKMVTKVINGLLKLGAEVIYESMYDVHVSGHACQEEQKLILSLAKPQYFMPVHGEYKQLRKHAMTAEAMGIDPKNIIIAENGDCIAFSQTAVRREAPVPAGAVFVDGLGVGDVGNVVMRDRRHLSEDGLVIVVATVDSASGEVLSGPDIVSRGFVYMREAEPIINGATEQVRRVLDDCRMDGVRDWNSMKARIRDAVSAYLYRNTKRSPMILPIIMNV